MKTIDLLMITAALLFAGFFGCSKKSDSPAAQSGSSGMTASINGVAFNVDSCIYLPYAPDPTYIEIYATPKIATSTTIPYPKVDIEIHPYHGMGAYTIDANNTNINIITSSTATLYSGTGTVTVTQTDPYVAGTFSFIATNTTQVTNGSFTAAYK